MSHDILLRKLERSCGIEGPALALLRSYLQDRVQRTRMTAGQSSWRSTSGRSPRGVPQGSVVVLFSTPKWTYFQPHPKWTYFQPLARKTESGLIFNPKVDLFSTPAGVENKSTSAGRFSIMYFLCVSCISIVKLVLFSTPPRG